MQKQIQQLWSDLRHRLLGTGPAAVEPALAFERFRKVLNSNNQALEIIADLGEKLGGDYIFDRHYIETGVERLSGTVKASIDALNELCDNRFENLNTIYEGLTAELKRLLTGTEDRKGPQVMDLDAIHFLDWEIVGGKGARLAEMRQDSSLRVPPGFVITTRTYHELIDHNGLRAQLDTLQKLLADPAADAAIVDGFRRKLATGIMKAEPPPQLLKNLEAALTNAADNSQKSLFLAVRSSAQEEDMDYSFAGQFQSIINVKGSVAEVFKAYLQVAASLFSRDALSYYRMVRPGERLMSIAAVCQHMVAARSSGVAFSVDTMEPDRDTMVIVGAWGQGDAIVEGHTPTDTFIISKDDPPDILERAIVSKPRGRFQAEPGGLESRKIASDLRNQPCLSDTELLQIFHKVRQLELLYKRPQDVEWSVDEGGDLFILQARPLVLSQAAHQSKSLPEALAGYERLAEDRGRVAQQGIGAGPVRIVNGPGDLADFPDGAVLVSRIDSSHFVKVMKRAAAIVTEIGTPVSHMATLCRELRVPCLVNVGNIISQVKNGEEITVDAEDRVIYRGRARELLVYSSTSTMQLNSSPEFLLLRRILKKVAILNLIDPLLQSFSV
ncbi:MAG TPA: hypothetical protein DDX85_01455, partial [Nitrospiraceae bacterium]|nr:hypothetical protein [Nitrospiraceae bacterium]